MGEVVWHPQSRSHGNADKIVDITKNIEAGEEVVEAYLLASAGGDWIRKKITIESSSLEILNQWANWGREKYLSYDEE